MPDSYGRPLWMSPRLRWEMSHAAPIVRNTNETPANKNPTTYQIPVNDGHSRSARATADPRPLLRERVHPGLARPVRRPVFAHRHSIVPGRFRRPSRRIPEGHLGIAAGTA